MHQCMRSGCEVRVPARMLACREHWFELPQPLREGIWRNYREGQEHTGNPSAQYLAALHACIAWWEEHGTL